MTWDDGHLLVGLVRAGSQAFRHEARGAVTPRTDAVAGGAPQSRCILASVSGPAIGSSVSVYRRWRNRASFGTCPDQAEEGANFGLEFRFAPR